MQSNLGLPILRQMSLSLGQRGGMQVRGPQRNEYGKHGLFEHLCLMLAIWSCGLILFTKNDTFKI